MQALYEVPAYITNERARLIAKRIIDSGWYFLPEGTRLVITDRGWYSTKVPRENEFEGCGSLPGWPAARYLGKDLVVGLVDVYTRLIGFRRISNRPERFVRSDKAWAKLIETEEKITR